MDRRGITLLELVLVLLVLGVIAHLSILPLRSQVDRIVLRSVREEIIALFHRARMEGRLHGGSTLRIAEGEDLRLEVGEGRPAPRVAILERGVDLEIAGSRDEVGLEYGPLGIANFASTTLILRRRGAESRLVVSGYGRVRR